MDILIEKIEINCKRVIFQQTATTPTAQRSADLRVEMIFSTFGREMRVIKLSPLIAVSAMVCDLLDSSLEQSISWAYELLFLTLLSSLSVD